MNLPDALSAYHRRQSDGPADKEFCDAVQHDLLESKISGYTDGNWQRTYLNVISNPQNYKKK